MKALRESREAADEIDHALALSDVPAEFRAAIDDALALVASGILTPPRIGRSRFREFVMNQFPYSLILEEFPDRIRVVAFAHHSREPGYWRDKAELTHPMPGG